MVAIERGLRPDEQKRGRGKPPDFTFGQDWADRICNWIANGGTLAAFCQFTTSPSCSTVFRWLRKYPEFMEDYARARMSLGMTRWRGAPHRGYSPTWNKNNREG